MLCERGLEGSDVYRGQNGQYGNGINGNSPCYINVLYGDTPSNGCFFIVVFLFSGVLFEEVLDLNLPQGVDL